MIVINTNRKLLFLIYSMIRVTLNSICKVCDVHGLQFIVAEHQGD